MFLCYLRLHLVCRKANDVHFRLVSGFHVRKFRRLQFTTLTLSQIFNIIDNLRCTYLHDVITSTIAGY